MRQIMSEKELTVEELMENLQNITTRMEKEALPLSDMMKLYKEGKELEKKIRERLDLTEKEIEILSAEAPQQEEA